MKIRISYVIGVIILLQLTLPRVIAQSLPKGEVDITVKQFEKKQELLYIKFHLDISNIKIKSKQALFYTAVIYTPTKNIEFPEISFRGSNNYRSYIRKVTLGDQSYKPTIKAFGKNRESLDYEYVIPYEDWMEGSELMIKKYVSNCGNRVSLGSDILAKLTTDVISVVEEIPTEIPTEHLNASHISKYEDDLDAIYSQEDGDIFKIYFPINVSEIGESYMDNAEELARLGGVINQVRASRDFKIAKVFIVGFASIDGSYVDNEMLSLKRTESIDNYLSRRINLNESLIEVYIGAENWYGLEKMVIDSNIADKAEILYIINNVQNQEKRSSMLKNLNRGETYKYMIDNFFAQLRYVYVKVYINDK